MARQVSTVGQHDRGPVRGRLPGMRRRSEPGLVRDLLGTAQNLGIYGTKEGAEAALMDHIGMQTR